MRSGLVIWRGGESSKRTMEDATYAFTYLLEDLSTIFTSEVELPSLAADRPIPVSVKLISDYDKDGLQRLIFVRTIPSTIWNAVGAAAGNLADDDGDAASYPTDGKDNDCDDVLTRLDGLDNDGNEQTLRGDGADNDSDGQTDESGEGVDDPGESGIDEPNEGIDEEWYNGKDDDGDNRIDEDLRSLGGLMQVVYYLEGPTAAERAAKPASTLFPYKLCRGFQAPIASIRRPGPAEPQALRDAWDKWKGFYFAADPPGEPILRNVLYFGVRFWTQKTKLWDDNKAVVPDGGCEIGWDSTRGITGQDLGVSANLFGYKGATSLQDPSDDIFPEKVRITIVLLPELGNPITRLAQDLDANATGEVKVESTDGLPTTKNTFIRVGDEWLHYDGVKDRTTIVVSAVNGRGARGTIPAAHPAGSEMAAGVTYEVTLSLPGYKPAKDIP